MEKGNKGRLMSSNGPQSKLRWVLFPLIALCAVLFVAMFVPVMDGPNSRRHAREAVSVSTLLSIVRLQSSFAVAHPTIGFACELSRLRSEEELVKNAYVDVNKFFMTGERVGYKFAIVDCRADANGVVTHYQLTLILKNRNH